MTRLKKGMAVMHVKGGADSGVVVRVARDGTWVDVRWTWGSLSWPKRQLKPEDIILVAEFGDAA